MTPTIETSPIPSPAKSTETFVFLGTISEVPAARIKLTQFGQRVELTADLAEGTKEDGGLLCIPASDFDPLVEECGVNAKTLAKFGKAAAQANAPKEFMELVARARQILHDRREPGREALRQAQEAARAAALLAEQPKEEAE